MTSHLDEERMIDLETKYAHQEVALEALQQTVLEQQKIIDRLTAKLERLTRRLDALGDGGLDIGPANEKPPHY
jgi:SlyX protein